MKDNDIRRAREKLQDTGPQTDRRAVRSGLIDDLKHDLQDLAHRKRSLVAEARAWTAAWASIELPPDAVPIAPLADVANHRWYWKAAFPTLATEAGLAAWIFFHQGMPWLIGVVSALLIPLILHAALYFLLFDRNLRPKEGMRTLERRVIKPAFKGSITSLAVAFLARNIAGPLAFFLLPFFGLALWVATIALMFLSGGFLVASLVYGTSIRYEHKHRDLDQEDHATARFLGELQREELTTAAVMPQLEYGIVSEQLLPERPGRPPDLPPAQAAPAQISNGPAEFPSERLPLQQPTGSGAVSPMIALLFAAMLTTGVLACSPTPAPVLARATALSAFAAVGSGPAHEAAEPTSPQCAVGLDVSGSLVGLKEVWDRVRAELPDLAVNYGCTLLTVWSFAKDGWMPERLAEFELPRTATASRDAELRMD